MAPRPTRLSKSKIAAFEQCPKRLWLSVHRPELAEVTTASASAFQVGHEVGTIACAAYPDGVMIAPDNDLRAALKQTSELIGSGIRRPLFEATFSHEDVLVRADLLIPDGQGWHLVEVKSSGSVKDYHMGDLATQLWVTRGAGLQVTRASVRHIDTCFVYEREGEYGGLLADADLGDTVAGIVKERPDVVASAKAALAGPEPSIEIGAQCSDPFECPFTGYCSRNLPPAAAYPVTLLPRQPGKNAARALLDQGFADLRDVPEGFPLPESLKRIHDATRTGVEFHDLAGFAAETKEWRWPRYFLDFETISFAVPRWLGTKPFQNIPFQFSCHIEQEDGVIDHRSFLNLSGTDPSHACAEALLATLGDTGAIITYFASFERGVIMALAERCPSLALQLKALAARIVDLLPAVRRHYYHRDMRGSYSIKAVLPARLPDLSYDKLEGVQNGLAAQGAYLEATGEATIPARKDELQRQLLAYCEMDTWAMVKLTGALAVPASSRQ